MIPTRSYTPDEDSFPLFGLDTRSPTTMLKPGLSPSCLNVIFDNYICSKRSGYSLLGDIGVSDPIIGLVQLEKTDGTRYLVAVTTSEMYKLDTSDMTWDDLSTNSDWDGDLDNNFDYAIVVDSAEKKLVITNGADSVLVWDGAASDFALLDVSDFDNFVSTKCIAYFKNYMFFANYTDTTTRPQGIAWTDAGSITSWSTGTAGSATLTDVKGEILKLLPLGDRLAIYAEDSISTATFVGGDLNFFFETRIFNARIASAKCIVDLGRFHVYMTEEGFFMFDGSRSIISAGELVSDDYKHNVNPDYVERSFAYHDAPNMRVFFFVPTDSEYPDTAYVMYYNLNDFSEIRWTKMTFGSNMATAGGYVAVPTLTWDSGILLGPPVVTWENKAQNWEDASQEEGFQNMILGSVSGDVFLYGNITRQDESTAIEAYFETKDFAVPKVYRSMNGRWLELEAELSGESVTVSYSTDRGQTWTDISTETLENDWENYRFFFDTVSETIRFKFTNDSASSSFKLRWFRVWVRGTGF